MGDLFNPMQIVEIVLEGLSTIKGVFDIILILTLIPAILGGAFRSLYKTLFRFVVYAIIFLVAFLMIDQAANFVGDELLGMVGFQLTLTYNDVTTTYNSLREYFVAILSYSSANGDMIEGITQTLLKNVAWILIFPIASLFGYLLTTIIWPIGMLFFPGPLRKKIKKTKFRLINIPLSIVMSLTLSLLAIAPYVNFSHALSNIVVEVESPIGFLSPYYGRILAWFTPSGSYILQFLQYIRIPELFVFFDEFRLPNSTTVYQFAPELETILNEVGAITPA
jgi:hypothetical protein